MLISVYLKETVHWCLKDIPRIFTNTCYHVVVFRSEKSTDKWLWYIEKYVRHLKLQKGTHSRLSRLCHLRRSRLLRTLKPFSQFPVGSFMLVPEGFRVGNSVGRSVGRSVPYHYSFRGSSGYATLARANNLFRGGRSRGRANKSLGNDDEITKFIVRIWMHGRYTSNYVE